MEKLKPVNSEKRLYITWTVIAIMAILFATALYSTLNVFGSHAISNEPAVNSGEGIHYKANVCRTVTRIDGTQETECSHNLLYNNGKEMIEQILGAGVNEHPILNISLCNATAGCGAIQADNSEAFTAYSNCGLNNLVGTYSSLGTGNWSIAKTFISTCDNVIMNSTRLGNSTNGLFAGNVFTLVTLQTNDQLTINWTIAVT